MIAIDETGQVFFSNGEEDSRAISTQDILPSAAFIMSKNSLKYFLIKADGDAEYRYIDQVMEQLRQAAVRNIAMLTQQEGVVG